MTSGSVAVATGAAVVAGGRRRRGPVRHLPCGAPACASRCHPPRVMALAQSASRATSRSISRPGSRTAAHPLDEPRWPRSQRRPLQLCRGRTWRDHSGADSRRPVSLRVPAGTKSGRTPRVGGKGSQATGGTGDLLTVEVEVSQSLNVEERAAVEELPKAMAARNPRAVLGRTLSVSVTVGSPIREKFPTS